MISRSMAVRLFSCNTERHFKSCILIAIVNSVSLNHCLLSRMATLLEQLDQVRCQAEACLYTTGSVLEVRAGVSAMANVPLPPSVKYRYIAAEAMIIENTVGLQRKEVCGITKMLCCCLPCQPVQYTVLILTMVNNKAKAFTHRQYI